MKERFGTVSEKRLSPGLFLVLVVTLAAMLLSGCGIVPALGILAPVGKNVNADESVPPVFVPEAIRNTALLFIQESFDQIELPGFQDWDVGGFLSGASGESMTYQFNAPGWITRISFPSDSTESTIYIVNIQGGTQNFSWEGMVNGLGQAVTTKVTFDDIVPPAAFLHYQDDDFRLALDYPADWTLSVESIRGSGSSTAKALRFDKDSYTVVVYYKYTWDEFILGGELPLGDVVDRGLVTFLGRSVTRHYVVHDGKDKVLFFGGKFEELEFIVEAGASPTSGEIYYDIDLPESLQAEVDQIVAGLVRTGSPIPAPIPTSIPPTPEVKSYCDWATFLADVTIPDGTTIKTGTTFVKTWRLKNRGNCTWSPDYALVFSSGSQMGGTVAVKLPGYVAPGETVDVSVALTSPEVPGSYRGYWMLRNASGVLFGYGESANKAFFVDIRSVDNSLASVAGKICFPGSHIPPMNLYLQNMDNNKLTRISILENQLSYHVQVEPGNYLAYAWTLNFEIAGGYTLPDHRLDAFRTYAGKTTGGIDICDWYVEPGTIPLPSPENYGTISGKLSFPSEQIPPLRIVAFDIYSNAYYSVDTTTNQQTYAISNLPPGYYKVVAFVKDGELAGGYSEYVKCGFNNECPHDLVVVYITPGQTVSNIDPGDWYAPEGSFPPDPTR
ncbi:MAG: NBR1-Ig-like domain-containing protein [Chloroflexota bacterium]